MKRKQSGKPQKRRLFTDSHRKANEGLVPKFATCSERGPCAQVRNMLGVLTDLGLHQTHVVGDLLRFSPEETAFEMPELASPVHFLAKKRHKRHEKNLHESRTENL